MSWVPARHMLLFWRLERAILLADYPPGIIIEVDRFSRTAGIAGYKFLRFRNGRVVDFWTRKQAQLYADLLNNQAGMLR